MGKLRTWLAREDWIAACEFHPEQESDVFTRIADKINENSGLKRKPFVLLDLDSTLYEVGPRTLHILREAATTLGTSMPAPVRTALDQLSEPKTGYSIEDTWEKLGLCLKSPELSPARDRLRSFWRERFFSNEYLALDIPYPGTRDFACQLHDLGAEIVYLTGRDEAGMKEGTLRNLARDGFPIGPNTQLRMKADREDDDVEHKVGVALHLQKQGEVVASFENEPRNFVALFQALPKSIHVFVDTICSDKPAPAVRGAYRLKRFRA